MVTASPGCAVGAHEITPQQRHTLCSKHVHFRSIRSAHVSDHPHHPPPQPPTTTVGWRTPPHQQTTSVYKHTLLIHTLRCHRAQYGARPVRAGQSKRECVFASVHARPIHIPSPSCCDSPIVLRSPHCVVIPLCSRHQTRHWSRLPSRHQTALGGSYLEFLLSE